VAEQYLPPTPRQQQAYDLYAAQEKKSITEVAFKLGITRSTASDLIRQAKARIESKKRLAPVEVPTGMRLTKTTVAYDAQGNVEREWRRLSPQAQALEALADRLAIDVEGKGSAPVRKERKTERDDHLLEIAISDAHIGMYAWKDETGQGEYDVSVATDAVLRAVDDITSRCRPHKTVLVFNGDTIHADNRSGKTERSGNVLDVDGRYAQILDHTVQCIQGAVDAAARVSKHVALLVVPGNHDWHTAICMGRILAAYYHKAKNVSVVGGSRPRYAMQWGDCMLSWAHGDRIKPSEWAKLIPAEYPSLWGATKKRFLHLGHVHHKRAFAPVTVDEQAGLVVEYLSALCPPDAYHVESGYIGALRGAEGFLYNKTGLDARWPYNA